MVCAVMLVLRPPLLYIYESKKQNAAPVLWGQGYCI
jgi:hypothetical protein